MSGVPLRAFRALCGQSSGLLTVEPQIARSAQNADPGARRNRKENVGTALAAVLLRGTVEGEASPEGWNDECRMTNGVASPLGWKCEEGSQPCGLE